MQSETSGSTLYVYIWFSIQVFIQMLKKISSLKSYKMCFITHPISLLILLTKTFVFFLIIEIKLK